MKKLLVLSLFTLPVGAFAQTVSSQPFKKANIILIQTPDSGVVALKKIGALLVDKGFVIQKLDTDFNTLTTEPKQIKSGVTPTTLTVKVTTKGALLRLSGWAAVDMSAFDSKQHIVPIRVIANGVKPGSLFMQLMEPAQAYSGASVQYTVE
ncbi:hypothetical protein [Hymenobacter mucosus]|uniref:Uncharacterized protein n=1 Tax=Hymenobacter mucosus TaxID=1411120 RepID=A0A239AAX8_9BACT|nr:hypothetical protein [Hymenobacter mucosus]SNR92491.1 hypothetical protein SAMN06269173_111102 [Hymenobacter mucosus]